MYVFLILQCYIGRSMCPTDQVYVASALEAWSALAFVLHFCQDSCHAA